MSTPLRLCLALAFFLLASLSTTAFLLPPRHRSCCSRPEPEPYHHDPHPHHHQDATPRDVHTRSALRDDTNDPLRQDDYWEELFKKGATTTTPTPPTPTMSGEPSASRTAWEPVEVVSFDLDDTLWCGNKVISNANT